MDYNTPSNFHDNVRMDIKRNQTATMISSLSTSVPISLHSTEDVYDKIRYTHFSYAYDGYFDYEFYVNCQLTA